MALRAVKPSAMMLDDKKTLAADWFRTLRNDICARFEAIESEYSNAVGAEEVSQNVAAFSYTPWNHPTGGGGEIGRMSGRVFEKVGVNISTTHGEFSEAFRKEIPGAAEDPRYWAAGISLVAHMRSPKVPAAHFNTRMIVTGNGARLWFGGGGDLNPMVEVPQDTADFHAAFRAACDKHDPSLSPQSGAQPPNTMKNFYEAFKEWCDEYFYIPHRQQARGVGGIFYDYLGLNSLGTDTTPVDPAQFGKGGVGKERTRAGMLVANNAAMQWNEAFAFTQDVGRAFAEIYPALIKRRMFEPFTEADREYQFRKRGLYAEYNLLYDRGTRFGLMVGGNPDAILMSLPPIAKWD